MKRAYKQWTGFTLIELMIVVAIIGILAAVAIPKFGNLVTKSKESQILSKLANIRSALSIYYADNQNFPASLTVGLTTGAHYLDVIPDVTIPAVEPNNPGHLNIVGESVVTDDMVSGAWYYQSATDFTSVNCSHMDTKGYVWSSY